MPPPSFADRDKPDGTRDSICLKCYMTVPTRCGSDLVTRQNLHVCRPSENEILLDVLRRLAQLRPKLTSS
jgi:hypothetical protein